MLNNFKDNQTKEMKDREMLAGDPSPSNDEALNKCNNGNFTINKEIDNNSEQLKSTETFLDHIFKYVSEGECIEIRSLNGQPKTGFYDNIDDALKAITNFYSSYKNQALYITPNPVSIKKLKKRNSSFKTNMPIGSYYNKGKPFATLDKDIVRYAYILIDIDTADKPSTPAQKECGYELGKNIIKNELNGTFSIFNHSGNGFHILVAIELENTPQNIKNVKVFFKKLAKKYNTEIVFIDLKVFNPSRICKIPGSIQNSYVIESNDCSNLFTIPVNDEALDFNLNSELLNNTECSTALNIEEQKDKVKWVISQISDKSEDGFDENEEFYKCYVQCQNKGNHTNQICKPKDAYIFVSKTSGKTGFHCSHNHCQHLDFQDYLKLAGLHEKFNERFYSKSKNTKLPELPKTGSLVIDPGHFPRHLLKVPGLINDIYEFNIHNAPVPNNVMSLLGAIAIVAFLIGKKIRSETDLRTNLYLLGLGYSSSGKDYPRTTNKNILQIFDLSKNTFENLGSGQGLEDQLAIEPYLLGQIDEIDSILGIMSQNREDKSMAYLSKVLLTTYTSANSFMKKRLLSSSPDAKIIYNPYLTILGTATPRHYYESLSESMLTNGFIGRTLALECYPKEPGRFEPAQSISQKIIDSCKYWLDLKLDETPDRKNNLHIMKESPDVVKLIREYNILFENEYAKYEKKGDAIGTTIWGRAREQMIKLAMIYSASAEPTKFKMLPEAVEWAYEVITYQIKKMLFMTSKFTSDSKSAKELNRLLDKLPLNKPISRSEVIRLIRLDRVKLDILLDTLIEGGEVKVIDDNSNSRATYYLRVE